MRNHVVLGVAVAVMLSAASQVAHAAWEICNNTPEILDVAIAYASNRGHIITSGWWRIQPCGRCTIVLQAGETADRETVYLHAKTDGGLVYVGGNERFCMARSNFKFRSTPDCVTKSSFQQRKVNLNKHWKTNITGRSSSGKQCF